MSEENIVRYTAEEIRAMIERGESRTDWARVNAMTEAELEAAIASDPDWADIPADWLSSPEAVLVDGRGNRRVAVAAEVAEWFQRQGGDYQGRINDVLRAYIRAHDDVAAE